MLLTGLAAFVLILLNLYALATILLWSCLSKLRAMQEDISAATAIVLDAARTQPPNE